MESFEARLKRFLDGPPLELLGTLVASMQMNLMPQIKLAVEHRADYLVVLGTHAVIQVVAGKVFGKSGSDGTEFFLREFVDVAGTPGQMFSSIATEIHELRNEIAHQWLAAQHHKRSFDWELDTGWKWINGRLHINLTTYFDQFEHGLNKRYFGFVRKLPPDELLIRKFRVLRLWLGLEKTDFIFNEIGALAKGQSLATLEGQEEKITIAIRARYGLW